MKPTDTPSIADDMAQIVPNMKWSEVRRLDHFAGLAMQGLIFKTLWPDEAIAKRSYAMAAAMIAERNRILSEQ